MAGDTTITIVGNLTGDPELRFLPNGDGMAKFTVASTPRVFDRDKNEYRDGDPLFLTCTVWRELAEHVAESLTKGTRVIVQGRLRLSRWEDKETGEKRSTYGLDVDEVGPSLRFAQAKVTKTTRSKPSDGFTPANVPDDPFRTRHPGLGLGGVIGMDTHSVDVGNRVADDLPTIADPVLGPDQLAVVSAYMLIGGEPGSGMSALLNLATVYRALSMDDTAPDNGRSGAVR